MTNNDIRLILGEPVNPDLKFKVNKVDSLISSVIHDNTLLFINKEGQNLDVLDNYYGMNCVYLVDADIYDRNYHSKLMNDFIFVKNPKYAFCNVLQTHLLPSVCQLEFSPNPKSHCKYECREVLVGENTHIDSGAIIGGVDFSPVLADDGTLVQFPQLGGVMIGDNVVIKYNTMVGKGTFNYTIIDNNTMIDYGCQIGHNCKIGRRCIIAAGTIIGGSTIIGDCTTIGIGACIRNGLHIGSNVSIGMGSVVIRDIPDNAVVVGNPAHPIEHERMFTEKGLI